MQTESPMTPAEEWVMEETFKTTMIRAADIIDRITESDGADARKEMALLGAPAAFLATLDRAKVGSIWLRLCAEGKALDV
jgi:hypothetical protein